MSNKTNLRDVCKRIRKAVRAAEDRPELTELYRRAGFLVTLSYASSWPKKFGDKIEVIRRVAQQEFSKTARTINRRAKEIKMEADDDETWGRS